MPGGLASLATGGEWKYGRHHEFIEDKLLEVVDGKCRRLMVSLPPQHGKLIASFTPVMTTKGWKNHGDLKVGDYVFGLDGKPTEVIAVSSEGEATHTVVFSDGSEIDCHENHEWQIHERGAGTRVYETKEMIQRGTQHCRNNRNKFMLPHYEALQLKDVNLPIDPYVFGVWLGDGNKKTASITSHKNDYNYIVDEFENRGYPLKRLRAHVENDGVDPQGFVRKKTTDVFYSHYCGLREDLKRCGFLFNKHIPECYLLSSIEQRKELIAGLLDTDGNWSPQGGQLRITNTNKGIIDGACQIVRSLGYAAGISKYPPVTSSSGIVGKKDVYVLYWTPRETFPTKIPRKTVSKTSKTHRRRSIEQIKKLHRPLKGQCIQVSAKDGIYLVGKNLIPTHNSSLVSQYFTAWLLGRYPYKRVILTSYEATFAASWGRKSRQVLEEYGPSVFGVGVSQATSAVDNWETDVPGTAGGMRTAGAGGPITGKGADIIIIDDPVKNDKEALSPKQQEDIWEWYRATVYTRQSPKCAIILIMTRWAKDDLAGRLIEEMKSGGEHMDHWEVVNIPAIAEEDDQLGRQPGEPLWPEHGYDYDWLMKTKRIQGTYWWCTPSETPILMSDFSTKPISEIKKGDKVIGFERGSGDSREGKGVQTKGGLVVTEVKNVFKKYDMVMNLTMDSGRKIRCTKEHKWYTGRSEPKRMYRPAHVGSKLRHVEGICEIEEPLTGRQKNLWHYLAGVFDGEGSLANPAVATITQTYDKNSATLEKIGEILDELRIPHTRKEYKTKQADWSDGRTYVIHDAWNFYLNLLKHTCVAKRDEIIDRQLQKSGWCMKERDIVLDMQESGFEDVYALETGTGNYIAWGYASSNSALYQQRPAAIEGDMIKVNWFKRYVLPPGDMVKWAKKEFDEIVISWDTAQKEAELNDYTVAGVWGVTEFGYYLLDLVRDKYSHPRLLQVAKSMNAKWTPNVNVIEDKASGISLIQHLESETRIPVFKINPERDKVVRMNSESPQIESGIVYLPDPGNPNTQWLFDFEEECRGFPNVVHKDQVDMMSQFLKFAREKLAYRLEMW